MRWQWTETVALKEHYRKIPMEELLSILQSLNDKKQRRTPSQVHDKVRDLRSRNGWKF